MFTLALTLTLSSDSLNSGLAQLYSSEADTLLEDRGCRGPRKREREGGGDTGIGIGIGVKGVV
jgi:hypothetical protein